MLIEKETRHFYIKKDGEFTKTEFENLRAGDTFRIWDANGKRIVRQGTVTFRAIGDATPEGTIMIRSNE